MLRGREEIRPDDNQTICTINELFYYVFTKEGLLVVVHIKVLNVWLHRRTTLVTLRHILDLRCLLAVESFLIFVQYCFEIESRKSRYRKKLLRVSV